VSCRYGRVEHSGYSRGVWTTIHRGTMASPGLFYLFVSLRTQTNAAIQCLTRPMYCSTIDASTRAGGLDAVRIASAGRFSSRYGRLPLRRAAAWSGLIKCRCLQGIFRHALRWDGTGGLWAVLKPKTIPKPHSNDSNIARTPFVALKDTEWHVLHVQ